MAANKRRMLSIKLSKLGRSHSFELAEAFDKIAAVHKARLTSDLLHGHLSRQQDLLGKRQPICQHVISKGAANNFVKHAAEIKAAEPAISRHFIKKQRLRAVQSNVICSISDFIMGF